jgi:RimJ/RimL family protein N-acetyltransferase
MAKLAAKEHRLSDGATVIVRSAKDEDAAQLLECTKACVKDGTGLITEVSEYMRTKDQELMRIKTFSANANDIMLIAEDQKTKMLIGMLDFKTGKRRRLAHTGDFGMAVHPAWRQKGVGSLLLNALIEFAIANKHIEKINLRVLGTNERAIALYKKFGFAEEGTAKREIKWNDGTYSDELIMAKFV